MTITKETIESAKGRFNIYTLVNATGAAVRLSEIGAGIVALTAPDGHGRLAEEQHPVAAEQPVQLVGISREPVVQRLLLLVGQRHG